MVHECKQSMTTSRTHVKKSFQVNTFHDDFKAWMDFYRHCVCLWSYLKYTFSFYKVKLWQSNRGIPVAIVMLSNLHITRGLCSYNARLFNDDVTAIGASYWRRREFPNYARLHRGRISDILFFKPNRITFDFFLEVRVVARDVRKKYCQTSNIRRTVVANQIVDHSDVVGASPISAAPTTSSFSTPCLNGSGKDNCKMRQETFQFWDLVHLILAIWWYIPWGPFY